MTPIRFVMLGGFLGAGKTTTIARLARMYQAHGKQVAIVTNDQAADLVDTHSLRRQGFQVGEVAGACFCCNFNQLTETVEQLSATSRRPDILLAEPVGSCTDLVATVVRPLQKLFGDQFRMAPYGVLLKPSHGKRILAGGGTAGFSPKAEYVFRKQVEEADFLLLNRIDELSQPQREEIANLLRDQFPDLPLQSISARTGDGFDELLEALDQPGSVGRRLIELDYDTYAEGEAELGWLNSSLEISSPRPFPLDALLVDLVAQLQARLAILSSETAHLKAIGMTDQAYAVANLVSSFTDVELSLPSAATTTSASVVVNARVAIDPAVLEEEVRAVVAAVATPRDASVKFHQTQSFRPGRPVPTHRLLELVD